MKKMEKKESKRRNLIASYLDGPSASFGLLAEQFWAINLQGKLNEIARMRIDLEAVRERDTGVGI